MLAGLLFATEDAADRPDALAATLPFGGATLIEFQGRQAIAAGASQLLIVVSRVTPELLGAAARLGGRGVAVDVVRTAAEAAAKVHPLARVLVLADGLITSDATLAPFAEDGEDLLLVSETDRGLERIDAGYCWAGVARVSARRLGEVARLPREYDLLSSVLRVAAQHGAARLILPATEAAHGIVRDGRGLASRSRGVFAGLITTHQPWFERWVYGGLARLALPLLVGRGVTPAILIGAGGAGLALAGWALWRDWAVTGLALGAISGLCWFVAALLAVLRGEDGAGRIAGGGAAVATALILLLIGYADLRLTAAATGLLLAFTAGASLAFIARLRPIAQPRRWWLTPAACPALLLPFAAVGQVVVGLGTLALYAALTLLGAIEDAREP